LPPPLRDDARALELLGPLADSASPGVGRFAALLSSQISERQRIAREFVEAHGGKISLLAEERGAHFRVALPRRMAA